MSLLALSLELLRQANVHYMLLSRSDETLAIYSTFFTPTSRARATQPKPLMSERTLDLRFRGRP